MLKIKINDHEFQADTFADLVQDIYKHQSDKTLSELYEMIKEFVVDTCDIRICSHCGKPMIEGYCILQGQYYYCCDDCLNQNFTDEEYTELFEVDEAYWTDWR